jgi:catechol 2,3-dioxygenase-like lactoylglutathione lyase family enzyme
MLGADSIIGFIPTTNYRRAKAFYKGVLGLKFISQDPFALVLEGGGTMIRLTKVGDFTPGGYTIFGWKVGDIGKTAAGLKKRGVVFERYAWMKQDRLGVWDSPAGARVAWFKDPDGNLLSLSQHP